MLHTARERPWLTAGCAACGLNLVHPLRRLAQCSRSRELQARWSQVTVPAWSCGVLGEVRWVGWAGRGATRRGDFSGAPSLDASATAQLQPWGAVRQGCGATGLRGAVVAVYTRLRRGR